MLWQLVCGVFEMLCIFQIVFFTRSVESIYFDANISLTVALLLLQSKIKNSKDEIKTKRNTERKMMTTDLICYGSFSHIAQ